MSPRAAEIMEVAFVKPYKLARLYGEIGEQLDQLYHDVDAGKFGADAKTGTWFAAVKKVKDDFPKN